MKPVVPLLAAWLVAGPALVAYYVQGTITMGFMAGRPNLSPSDQATFDGMADMLKLAE